jgi:hypothetical protein
MTRIFLAERLLSGCGLGRHVESDVEGIAESGEVVARLAQPAKSI